jgi:hypothetical protein
MSLEQFILLRRPYCDFCAELVAPTHIETSADGTQYAVCDRHNGEPVRRKIATIKANLETLNLRTSRILEQSKLMDSKLQGDRELKSQTSAVRDPNRYRV